MNTSVEVPPRRLALLGFAALLVGTLMTAPARVEALPFVGADFQSYSARLLAEQHTQHIVSDNPHGPASKRVRHVRARHRRHRRLSHSLAALAGSSALLSANSNWPWSELHEGQQASLPGWNSTEQDATAASVTTDDDSDAVDEVAEGPDDGAQASDGSEADDQGAPASNAASDVIALAPDFVPDGTAYGDDQEVSKVFSEVADEPPLLPVNAAADILVPAAVPEPNSLVLATLATLAAWRVTRRGRGTLRAN